MLIGEAIGKISSDGYLCDACSAIVLTPRSPSMPLPFGTSWLRSAIEAHVFEKHERDIRIGVSLDGRVVISDERKWVRR